MKIFLEKQQRLMDLTLLIAIQINSPRLSEREEDSAGPIVKPPRQPLPTLSPRRTCYITEIESISNTKVESHCLVFKSTV